MTEQDHRVCPRCGQEAGDYHFCPSCLAPIDALSGIPAHARAAAAAVVHGDPVVTETSATTVQVEDERPPAEGVDSGPAAQTAAGRDARVGRLAEPRQDVARFEDVLTVLAPDGGAKAPQAALPDILLHPGHSSSVAPAVARLEDVLTVAPSVSSSRPVSVPPPAPAPEPEPEPDEAPASVPPPLAAQAPAVEVDVAPTVELDVPPAAEVSAVEVTARTLREAFWFEQASAFKGEAASRVSIPPPAPAPAAEAAAPVAVDAPAIVPAELPAAETSPNHWAIAAFLVALFALLVALTGRRR